MALAGTPASETPSLTTSWRATRRTFAPGAGRGGVPRAVSARRHAPSISARSASSVAYGTAAAGYAAARRSRRSRRACTSAGGRRPSAMAAAIASSVASCVARLPIAITMSAPASSALTAASPAA